MPRCPGTVIIAAILAASGGPGPARTRVRTELVRPLAPIVAEPIPPLLAATPADPEATGAIAPGHLPAAPPQQAGGLEIITDLSRLPAPVARTRERILAAAHSGNVGDLVAVMRANEPMPIFSLDSDADPAAYWKTNFPESGGLEILSTLVEILDAGFVHVDRGTPQELYLWPYFARAPLDKLTPAQKVDLFRIVTGSDYKIMLKSGAYNFYRIGIGPDGTWHFFVAGD